jgi:hypothetical protein
LQLETHPLSFGQMCDAALATGAGLVPDGSIQVGDVGPCLGFAQIHRTSLESFRSRWGSTIRDGNDPTLAHVAMELLGYVVNHYRILPLANTCMLSPTWDVTH